ncbi:MAG: RNA polymerase sigma factor [Lachnospiraceae bacterium]|nr:RNA polymerase sigma factor [Lachnospiraceae bacterium]
MLEDSEIIELYWERSENAIKETQNKYFGYAYSIIARIIANKEDAEECFDDSMLKLWNSIPPTRPQNLRLYLGKIVRNTAIDRLKNLTGKKRTAEIISLSEMENFEDDFQNIDKDIDKWTLVEIINSFLQEQKKLHRIVFVQKYWYFLSVNQISEANNISSSKALSILHRMRKKLKERLVREGYYFDE